MYDLPTVTTATVSGITTSSATCGGTVTSDGNATVTARGVCWGTTHNPTVDGQHTTDGTGTGSFTSSITGLTDNTTYYVRAYATNSEGTAYGEERTFTTEEELVYDLPTVMVVNINSSVYVATVSSRVTDDGGSDVVERGVCWATYENPTIADSHSSDGAGVGTYSSSIDGLTRNTTYHIRAYATNSVGTAYSNDATFTTLAELPTVTTSAVSDTAMTSATSGGNITDNGGTEITARGVCWNTTGNPTISGSHTSDGTGDGTFASYMSGLTPGTTYHVRAYATNQVGTSYGEEVEFTTVPNNSIAFDGNGASIASFTVAANNSVHFSKGNLQYTTSGIHPVATGGTATGTWRLATNQYDYIGSANSSISSSNTGWIDLFGWGTSGWNSGATGYMPYYSSNVASSYVPGGDTINSLTGNYANADWGVFNAISNGGNAPEMWRTLTYDEWQYLLFTRNTSSVNGTANARFAKAKVANFNGLIVFPDEYTHPDGITLPASVNNATAAFTANTYTADEWIAIEDSGAIFLPAAGYRQGTSVYSTASYGDYWTSVHGNSATRASALKFSSGECAPNQTHYRYNGESVRLVMGDATVYNPPTVVTTSATLLSSGSITVVGEVTGNGGGTDVTERGFCWSMTSPTPAISDSVVTCESGMGSFSRLFYNNQSNATYYFRAYARNCDSIGYGEVLSVTTGDIAGGIDSIGATNALFSVGEHNTVRFSQGNLQYTTTGSHAVATGGTESGTFRFATEQYNYRGTYNSNTSSTYTGWVDLFGWGTSGWNSGATYYLPYTTTSSYVGYIVGGDYANNLTGDHSNADWGVYNAISNGGNQPGLWRTMTYDEWRYLLFSRETMSLNGTANARFAKAKVASSSGIIIFPDNYIHPTELPLPTNINSESAAYTGNSYTVDEWHQLQDAGAVFLPAGGWRNGTSVNEAGSMALYWASTHGSTDSIACSMKATASTMVVQKISYRRNGESVRLVMGDATPYDLPTVTTSAASNTSSGTVSCGGEVTYDGGCASITARGVCYSTGHNPTIDGTHTSDGTGVGSFVSMIGSLQSNTTYYVRAYATNRTGTAYGDEVEITTGTIMGGIDANGATNKVFSVSDANTVRFSRGNLQYTTTGTHAVAIGGTAGGSFRFAENQYDCIGSPNSNIANTYTGWIDLFGWGTSGWNSGATGYMPYYSVSTSTNYTPGGDTASCLTGIYANADWGVFNAIANGGNTPQMWRSLTYEEWQYMLFTRDASSLNGTTNARFAKAQVNGKAGTIIFPDTYTHPTELALPTNINNTSAAFTSNSYTANEWVQMEDAGAVFLPAAGWRNGTTVNNVGELGDYWSSTCGTTQSNASGIQFTSSTFVAQQNYYRRNGESVRLVMGDLTVYALPNVSTEATLLSSGSVQTAGNVTYDGGGTAVTERGICWSTNHNPTTSDNVIAGGSGLGSYNILIGSLQSNTTYYFRAYASNQTGTAYGNEVEIATGNIAGSIDENGAFASLFSVSPTNTVRFSRGNLQYTTSGSHTVANGGTQSGTFRFAENQYVYNPGGANSSISSSYTGWISLFGFGTSGWSSGAQYCQPYASSISSGSAYNAGDSYGNSLTGDYANADWGVYNAISNGGNTPGLWRTMTADEWNYLLFAREASTVNGTANARFARGNVNGYSGLIVLPDSYTHPVEVTALSNINNTTSSYNGNSYTVEQWQQLQDAGAVFLPAAGYRSGTSVSQQNVNADYWTSDRGRELTRATAMSVATGEMSVSNGFYRYIGCNVRLVMGAASSYDLPTVSTTSIEDIGNGWGKGYGEVTEDGGAAVINRGICWSRSANPTLADHYAPSGSGQGSFDATLSGLQPNTTYHIRAYASNREGTAYGEEVTLATGSFAAAFDENGASHSTFSVSTTKQVHFSKGNLQYKAVGEHNVAGGGKAYGEWRFALRQYDYIGSTNTSTSATYTGWVDLFGYGTSGYYFSYSSFAPYSTTTTSSNYISGSYNLSGTYSNGDWGVYNAIASSGNTPGLWRTMTADEWNYLLFTREVSTVGGVDNARFAKATVAGNTGLIVFPDSYVHPDGLAQPTAINTVDAAFTANSYTGDEWIAIESAGAVFLPAAGSRNGTSYSNEGTYGLYRTASQGSGSNYASNLNFRATGVQVYNNGYNYMGYSVRLVMED